MNKDNPKAENDVEKVCRVDIKDETSPKKLNKILQKHKMFKGIGTLKDPESGQPILTHVEMNPDAKPVIQPPRPVPHHLEERTKRKLDYFVQEGVMTWTRPGEPIIYASPLVICIYKFGASRRLSVTLKLQNHKTYRRFNYIFELTMTR